MTIDDTMGEIYSITSPSGKKYVGQAYCFIRDKGKLKKHGTEGRWKSHINDKKDSCPGLSAAIRKYGSWNMVVRTLIVCPSWMLDYYERKYIRQLKTRTPNGYNLKSGGLGCRHAPETLEKLSISHKGERNWNYGNRGKITEEKTKDIISESLKGKQINKESNIREWKDLPKYIYYKYESDKKFEGFKVKNHPYIKPRQFSDTSLTMEQKLESAREYIKNNTLENPPETLLFPNNRDKWLDLPKYIYYKYDPGSTDGFRVRKHPTLPDKTFTKASMTMEQRLELAKEYLASIVCT